MNQVSLLTSQFVFSSLTLIFSWPANADVFPVVSCLQTKLLEEKHRSTTLCISLCAPNYCQEALKRLDTVLKFMMIMMMMRQL